MFFSHFLLDFMACDSELLWIIEIFKYTKSTSKELQYNKCWLKWKREGILDLNIEERYFRYFEEAAMSNQSNNLGQPNITSINTYVTLNYCHTPEDEDDTPDFEYK